MIGQFFTDEQWRMRRSCHGRTEVRYWSAERRARHLRNVRDWRWLTANWEARTVAAAPLVLQRARTTAVREYFWRYFSWRGVTFRGEPPVYRPGMRAARHLTWCREFWGWNVGRSDRIWRGRWSAKARALRLERIRREA